ncbi:MAG: hypothetical protein LBU24_01290 [Methanocalculaceae archaeon]|jgi:hypothetical protein|nr:hypothetical protein [Methanocalculaceae archaeon]
MNIRCKCLPEILLVILMAVSGLLAIRQLCQTDIFIAIGIELLVLSVGALLLRASFHLHRLEAQSVNRERIMRVDLEDLGRQLVQKQDATSQKVVEIVESIKSRMYR